MRPSGPQLNSFPKKSRASAAVAAAFTVVRTQMHLFASARAKARGGPEPNNKRLSTVAISQEPSLRNSYSESAAVDLEKPFPFMIQELMIHKGATDAIYLKISDY